MGGRARGRPGRRQTGSGAEVRFAGAGADAAGQDTSRAVCHACSDVRSSCCTISTPLGTTYEGLDFAIDIRISAILSLQQPLYYYRKLLSPLTLLWVHLLVYLSMTTFWREPSRTARS